MSDDLVPRQEQNPVYETDMPIRYEADGPVAWIIMDRPQFNNAQNSQMTYALDAAFERAVADDAIKVIVLAGDIGLRALHAGPIENSAAAEAMTSVLISINSRYKVDGAGIRITRLEQVKP